jgi:hypothetical protein
MRDRNPAPAPRDRKRTPRAKAETLRRKQERAFKYNRQGRKGS